MSKIRKIVAALLGVALVALPIGTNMVSAGATEDNGPEVCTVVVHHDAVPAVTHTVTVPIQRYSYTGGPQGLDANGVPVQTTAPGSDWQANTTTYNNGTSDGGHLGLYFVSSSNNGRGDWFYWATGTVVVVDTPEVPAYDKTIEVDCPTTPPPVPCEQTEEGCPTTPPPVPPTYDAFIFSTCETGTFVRGVGSGILNITVNGVLTQYNPYDGSDIFLDVVNGDVITAGFNGYDVKTLTVNLDCEVIVVTPTPAPNPGPGGPPWHSTWTPAPQPVQPNGPPANTAFTGFTAGALIPWAIGFALVGLLALGWAGRRSTKWEHFNW